MSSPVPSNRIWDRADELVLQWERASRIDRDLKGFSSRVLRELGEFCQASSAFYSDVNGTQERLASYRHDQTDLPHAPSETPIANDFSPVAKWQLPDGETGASPSSTLQIKQSLHPDVALSLSLNFASNRAVAISDSSRRQTISDVAKAGLEIISAVYLREQLATSLSNARIYEEQAQSVAALYQGTTLLESFQSIAKVSATQCAADRVSILRATPSGNLIVATSSTGIVDRRSRHAVLLQSLADESIRHDEEIQFTIGSGDSKTIASLEALDRYVIESGCRGIETRFIHRPSDPLQPVAIVVAEWFTAHRIEPNQSFQDHVNQAVLAAIDRDTSLWTQLLTRCGNAGLWRKAAITASFLLASFFILCFVPIKFSVPADGKIVPELRRKLFAPANATITRIAVRNGQSVKQGDELLTMRSMAIELRDEQLRGEWLTAKSQLASLAAVRTGARRGESDTAANALSVSANEESLKTQIAGLEKQLVLIDSQKQELTIYSPIDGKVDRWDLNQSLSMRPVAQGQYLFDVYSAQGGWVVELDVADKDISYLLAADGGIRFASCRLQSQPSQIFCAVVTEIAESAQLDPQGHSVVRLRCSVADGAFVPDAIGATVWADVDCGRRPIGFIWFRGLIEWFERQSWY